MCGYFGNLHESPVVIDLFNQLGIPLPYPQAQNYPRRPIKGLVTCEDQDYKVSEAIWWYQLKKDTNLSNNTSPNASSPNASSPNASSPNSHSSNNKLVYNDKLTSFNARDLNKPLWKNAIKHRRGLVFATELGESKGKDRFLMRSQTGFALGAIYKDWPYQDEHGVLRTQRSMAIITRPPHHRFSQFHDKSIPLFIPLDKTVIQQWLDPEQETNLVVKELLDYPKLTTDLRVTQVKTYKHAEVLGDEELLLRDH